MTITIPPAALEAMRSYIGGRTGCWLLEHEARAAFLAMLENWPGAFEHTFRGPLEGHGLILPLTENTDDKA